MRIRLPNRRVALAEEIAFEGHVWRISLGLDAAGHAREIFMDGSKAGSPLERLLDDACVAVSLLLQHGVPAAGLWASLGRAGDPDGATTEEPSSPIGVAVRWAAAVEVGEVSA
jgi:hypothetical protein